MLTSPSAVLLDFDGTLLDTERSIRAGVAAASNVACELAAVDKKSWVSANAEVAEATWLASADAWILGQLPTRELSMTIYEQTLRLVGAPTFFAPRLVDVHAQAAIAAARPFADVPKFLATLRDVGVPVGLITNGAETQRELIDALGITGLFGSIVVSGEHAVAKPDRAIFDLACAQLGVSPEDTWHVGDSLEADIAGALAAGVSAVWVNRTGRARRDTDPVPDLTVESLDMLNPIIRAQPAQ
jgi:putative hydrolase of the HAD superfamily